MDLIEKVVDHVNTCTYQNLDQRTINAVKTVIIDAMGAAVAGSSGEGIANLVELAQGWGGKAEAQLLVHGTRLPAFHAALVNGAMARAWDIDDVHEGGGGHLGATIVTTAFVLAQYAGKKISGQNLMLGIALGTDLACRLRMALKVQYGWVTETFVPFGIVAMASKFLGFDRKQTLAAMGLAYTQCSCNSQGTVDGALSVRLQQGLSAKAGMLAVQFAQIGFTGPKDVLEGVYGLYPLYGRGEYNPAAITGGLGQAFEIANTSIKPYPSCKHTHIPIAAVSAMVKEHGIAPSDIKRVLVRTNKGAYERCASSPSKRKPDSVVDAQFSIPIMVALAATQGKVTLNDLIAENWRNADIVELAAKVDVTIDPELDRLPQLIVPNIIELETTAGARHVKRIDFVKGSPQDPMGTAECAEKFEDCMAIAAKPMAREKALRFVQLAKDLESVEDVRDMASLLVA